MIFSCCVAVAAAVVTVTSDCQTVHPSIPDKDNASDESLILSVLVQ